jgi:hypothetical protein
VKRLGRHKTIKTTKIRKEWKVEVVKNGMESRSVHVLTSSNPACLCHEIAASLIM